MCFKKISFLFTFTILICFQSVQAKKQPQTKIKTNTISKSNSELNIEAHPYYFLNQKDLNGFLHLDYKNFQRLNSSKYYQLNFYAEAGTLENSLGTNLFFNATGTKYLVKSETLVFSFGFLEHQYGLSRISSPLDFVDQKSYTDILSPKRFSDFSLRTSFKLGETFWRLSYIPYRFEMPFPGVKSFWLPRTLPPKVSEGSDTVEFPPDPTYEWLTYKHNNNSNFHNVALVGEFETKNWDWVWQYYRGLDTDTNLELELNTTVVSGNTVRTDYPILLRPVHNLIQRLGFGFVYTTPIQWRIIFENSVSLGKGNNSENVTENYIYNSSLSLEWGIPVFGDILKGVLQGFYGKSSNAQTGSTSILPPLQEALLLGFLWDQKNYELSVGYIKSYSLNVNVVQASLKLNFNENYYFKSTAAFIDGPVPEILSGFVKSDIVDAYLGYQARF